MRTEAIIKTYAKFNELNQEQKQKVIENFDRDGWLYEHCMKERIETLKKFATYINGSLDCSIGCVPDRGEFISIKDFNQAMYLKALKLKDCPFTGVCYDDDLIDCLNRFGELYAGLNCYLESIHQEYESMLTEDYIGDMCEANDYEFDLDTLEIA